MPLPPLDPPVLFYQYQLQEGDFDTAVQNYNRYLTDAVTRNYNDIQIDAVLRAALELRNNYRETNIQLWDNIVNEYINNYITEGDNNNQERLIEYNNNIINNNLQHQKKYIKYKTKYLKLKSKLKNN